MQYVIRKNNLNHLKDLQDGGYFTKKIPHCYNNNNNNKSL